MIIEFSIGNYRSFNEIQTLSFRATGLVSEDKTVDENNIAEINGQRLLKTVGVYGANASGKSNLIKGMLFLKKMVKLSLNNEEILNDFFDPNNRASISSPDNYGFFQIVLLIEGKKYRYGFALDGYQHIDSEWLSGPAKSNETYYFTRKGTEIKVNGEYFAEGLNIPYSTKLRANTLFLSFCSAYNGALSNAIRTFISNKIQYTGIRNNYMSTNKLVKNGNKELVLTWLRSADLFFSDIAIDKDIDPDVDTSGNQIWLYKDIGQQKDMAMDLENSESKGTQKFYAFIGKLYDKFENGGVLVSDEIDSNFHPTLLRKIISMFNNPGINKANAQLLFTSHDTNLMSPDIMRRDQLYFTEKSAKDATMLYSLSDLKGIRNNADFAKQYLAGFYGAIPLLGNYLEESINPET